VVTRRKEKDRIKRTDGETMGKSTERGLRMDNNIYGLRESWGLMGSSTDETVNGIDKT
jgi:hypothetical protein